MPSAKIKPTVAIARVCHEANRAYQIITDDPNPSEHWERTPVSVMMSAITGVEHALQGATPEELHESWCDTKAEQGWTYGAEKNPVLLTHPCLVAYGDLPEEQRVKDRLFQAIVHALAPDAIGRTACRFVGVGPTDDYCLEHQQFCDRPAQAQDVRRNLPA